MDARRLCSKILRLLTALSAGALLASCSADSSVSASAPSGDAGDKNSSVTVTKFQNSTTAFGVEVAGDGTLATVSQDFQFEGTCSRGVLNVKVYVKPPSGSYADTGVTAKCSSIQQFTWVKAGIGADGEYGVRFVPVNGLGFDATNGQAEETVLIDTTAPTAPNTFAVEGLAAADGSTKLVTLINPAITGSFGSDTKTLVVNTTGNFYSGTSCSGAPLCTGVAECGQMLGLTQFCFSPTLAEGEMRAMTFSSRDVYGNTSSPFSLTVGYIPPLAVDPKHIQFATITMMPQTSAGTTLVRASNEGFDGDSAVSVNGVNYNLRAGRVPYLVGLE